MGKGFLQCFPIVERCLCCFSLRTGCKIIAAWELIRHIIIMSSGITMAPTGDCGVPEYITLVYVLDLISISTVFGGATIFIFALLFLVFTSGKNNMTAGNCAAVFAYCLFISVVTALCSLLVLMIHAFLQHCSIQPWAVTLEVAGSFLGIYNSIVLYSYSVFLKMPAAPTETLPEDDVTKLIRLRSISINPPDDHPKKPESHLYSSHRRLHSISDLTSDHETNLDWGSRNLSERSNKEWGTRDPSARSNKEFGVKDKNKKVIDKDKNADKENKDKDYNQPGSSKGSKH